MPATTTTVGDRAITFVTRAPISVTLHFGDKVTIPDAALALDCSHATIYNLFDRGSLKRWAMGQRIYIPWGDIERILRDGMPENLGRRGHSRKKKIVVEVAA